MRPKRMTRAESREHTRRDLLDSAALCIAEQGLAASSVEDIAARAGYTRGAFYSNFASKRELFVELLRVKHRNIQENLETLLQDAAVSSEAVQQQFALLYARCYSSSVDYVVWAEARLQAERDADLREHVEAMCVERRDMIARFLDRGCMCRGTGASASSADRALVVIAIMDGLRYLGRS